MENIENAIKDICNCILDSAKEETKDKYGDLIEKITSEEYLEDMKKFNVFINYNLDKILKMCVEALNPNVDSDKISKLYFLYKEYSYLERNLKAVIKPKEGSSCCTDKTRFLLRSYKEYITEGTLPDMKVSKECYCKPNFGTGQEWMNLCEGLHYFYYGQPVKFLESLGELTFKKEDGGTNGCIC